MRAKITIVCLVLLSLALPAFALSITERNSESGAPEIVMENQYVKLIVAQKGGLISSFFYKPTGKEMVKTINDSDGPFGLLRDQFWQPNGYFREQFYLADIQQNQDSVELTLSATGPSGTHFFTKIEKTIIMRQASSTVEIAYTIENDVNSMQDMNYGFWLHNFMGVDGEQNTYFDPTTKGIVKLPYQPEKLEVWHNNPSRGWIGVAGESCGLVLAYDFHYADVTYHWGAERAVQPTSELRFRQINIKSGDKFQTKLYLVPFSGLEEISGAGGSAVLQAQIAKEERKCAVKISSCQEQNVKLVVEAVCGEEVKELSSREFQLAAEQVETAEIALPQLAEGAWLIKGKLLLDGEKIADFELPWLERVERYRYYMEPEYPLEKYNKSDEKVERVFTPSLDTVTEHFPWARPYVKPIRALVLTNETDLREVIELAQRLELDFTYVKFYVNPNGGPYLWFGEPTITSLMEAQDELLAKLDEEIYDVIVIGGLDYSYNFTDEIRGAIEDQIKMGTGLVMAAPLNITGDLAATGLFGIGNAKVIGTTNPWVPKTGHYITNAYPWEILPPAPYIVNTTPPQAGQVLAEIENTYPLIVVGQLEKGRVVDFTYNTHCYGPPITGAFSSSGLTPQLWSRGLYRSELKGKIPSFNALDYYDSLLARAVVWAAQKESGLQIKEIKLPVSTFTAAQLKAQQDFSLVFCQDNETEKSISIEVTVRNRFSEQIDFLKKEALLFKSSETVHLPFAFKSWEGLNTLDIVVKDEQRRVLCWGSAAYTVRNFPKIGGLEIVKDKFYPEDTALLNASVQLSNIQSGLKLKWELFDSRGRLVFSRSDDAVASGKYNLTAEIPRKIIISQGHEIRISLWEGANKLDGIKQRIYFLPDRNYDEFQFSSWNGGSLTWKESSFYPIVYQQLEKVGITNVIEGYLNRGSLESITEHGYWMYASNIWYNMNFTFLNMLVVALKDVPSFVDVKYEEKKSLYNATKDKKYLIREPSLYDPIYRMNLEKKVKSDVELAVSWGGAYAYVVGDEMSLTNYVEYFDYDFSEYSQAEFRNWCQGKYGSIAQLNALWGTNYTSWQDIVPLTLEEARINNKPAPWADFRTFTDDGMVDFFKFVSNTVKSVDPNGKLGISGTQKPAAANGYDYWKWAKNGIFEFMNTYNSRTWLIEVWRSFNKDRKIYMTPYRAGYAAGSGKHAEYDMWWSLFHATSGISAWTSNNFLWNDYTLSIIGQDTSQNMKEFKSGIWDLIQKAKRQDGKIAIHYSQASVQAAEYFQRRGAPVDNWTGYVDLIEDLGLQFDFLAYEQIEQGLLANYDLLIMPESIAISTREAQQIEKFVREGGIVIADGLTGLTDDHVRSLAQPLLDNLFGIDRLAAPSKRTDYINITDAFTELLVPGTTLSCPPVQKLRLRSGAKAYAASTVGSVPALIVNSTGEGKTVYLNFALWNLKDVRSNFDTAEMFKVRSLFAKIFFWAGLEPWCQVIEEREDFPSCIEFIHYELGANRLLGMLDSYNSGIPAGTPETPRQITVALPKSYHVYNMRTNEYLGYIDRVPLISERGTANLLYLSERQVTAQDFALNLPASAKLGEVVTVNVSGPEEDLHVVRVEVVSPQGDVVAGYCSNVIVENGAGKMEFPFSLNDELGTWTVVCRDAASGVMLERQIELRQ